MIDTPLNPVLPSSGSTATPIDLSSTTGCSDYIIQARGAVDMKISNVEAMTTYYTVKSGDWVPLSQVLAPGTTLFYAISGAAASVVEVLPLRK